MNQEELKPCPFCGSRDIEIHENKEGGFLYCIYILCLCCLARGPSTWEESVAIKKWNEVKR